MSNSVRFLLVIIILAFGSFSSLRAQTIEVISIEDDRFIDPQYSNPVLDVNDNACAIVHVVGLSQNGFVFEGNIVRSQIDQTEYYLNVPAGTRRLRIKHPDYWTTEVDFKAQGLKLISGGKYKLEVKAEKFGVDETENIDKKGTFLSIKTLPYGSNIILDGKSVGQTPWVDKIKKGTHTLEVSRENYVAIDTTLEIIKNTTTNIKGLLTKIETVCFHSNVPKCQVYVDGEKMGYSGDSVKVAVGGHHVRLLAPDYYDFNDSVLISPNQDHCDIYMYRKFHDKTIRNFGTDFTFKAVGDSLHHDYCVMKSSSIKENVKKAIAEFNRFPELDYEGMANKITAIRLSQVLNEPIIYKADTYQINDYSDIILSFDDLDNLGISAHKLYLKGIDDIKSKDYVNAFRSFRKAWEMGDNDDEVISALTWMNFETVIKIPNQGSAERYSKLAQKGFPKALFVMGWIYENGIFFPKNLTKARDMYAQAASVGDKASLWHLGWFAENGYACDKNDEIAAYYYSLASVSFCDEVVDGMKLSECATFALNEQLANKYSANELFVRGNSGKERHNQILIRESAHLGNIDAMREVLCIDCAFMGDESSLLHCVSLVDKQFVPLFIQKLAENNNQEACEKLGLYYGEERIDSCLYWLKRAVDLGNINAVQHQEKAVSKMADMNNMFEQKYYIAINDATFYDEPNGRISEYDEYYHVTKGDTISDGGGVYIDEEKDWLSYDVHGGYGGYYKKADFYTKIYKCSYLIKSDFIRSQGVLKFVTNDGRTLYIFEVNRNGYQIRDWEGRIVNMPLFAVQDEYSCLVYPEENGYINLNRYKAYAIMGCTRLIGKLTKDETLDYPIASDSEKNYPFCPYEVAILQGSLLYKYVPNEVEAGLNKRAKSNSSVSTVIDEEPVFPGGVKALMNFIAQNLRYPASAAQNRIQGRVSLSFIVDRDGSLTDIEEIQSPSPELTEEAKRVVRMMPKWIPGKNDGKPVRVKFLLPITFRIE